jgi:two-component system chemotaxis sensor kinase CheA
VVKRNIEALNGSVAILSEVGRGTRFRIKLPLTMAILDGLSVSLNGEIYILPLLSVIESFRPQRGDLRTVLGVGEVVIVRGENVPLLRLYHLFGAIAGVTDPTEGLIVIVENQGRKYGLLVDELVGQLQVVMKSVEENYHKIDGISGATILGDGRVALIVDVPGVCHLSRTSPPAQRMLEIESTSDNGLEALSETEPELCEMSAE